MADVAFKLRLLRAFVNEAFTSWRDQIWDKDLDSLYCCDGDCCCCGGETIRSIYSSCYPEQDPQP